MVKCSYCSKEVALLERKQIYNEETELYEYFCPYCYKGINEGKIKIPKRKPEKIIDRTEALSEAILKELRKIRHDLNVVYIILLVWFIFWIMSIFLIIARA